MLVAIPFFANEALPRDRLAGKIVVDATNYYPQRDGEMDFGGLTSSDVLGQHLSGARVVKAFNAIYYETLRTGAARTPRRRRSGWCSS